MSTINLAITVVEALTLEQKLRICSAVGEKTRHALDRSKASYGGTIEADYRLIERIHLHCISIDLFKADIDKYMQQYCYPVSNIRNQIL